MGSPQIRLKYAGITWRQRKSIHYLLAYDHDEEKVAEKIGITPTTLKRWMKEPAYQEELLSRMEKIENLNATTRAEKNKILSGAMYEELMHRIMDTKALKQMNTPQILRALGQLNHEIRVDTGHKYKLKEASRRSEERKRSEEELEKKAKKKKKKKKKKEVDSLDGLSDNFEKKRKKKARNLKLVKLPKEERNVG